MMRSELNTEKLAAWAYDVLMTLLVLGALYGLVLEFR